MNCRLDFDIQTKTEKVKRVFLGSVVYDANCKKQKLMIVIIDSDY